MQKTGLVRLLVFSALLLLAAGTQPLLAQPPVGAVGDGDLNADQLRAVVTDVTPEKDAVTVRPTELGSDVQLAENEVHTFKVDSET